MIFLLSAVKAREARHNTIDKTTEDDIKQFESERPNIELKKGLNMGNHTSAKSLQSYVAEKIGSAYVGVAVNIQNYSPFLLTDVQKNVIWGYTVFSTFQFWKCNHFHKYQGSQIRNCQNCHVNMSCLEDCSLVVFFNNESESVTGSL